MRLQCRHVQDTHSTSHIPPRPTPVAVKMMKITFFALGALALVCAFPQEQPQEQQPVQIIKQDSEVDINGYNFDFETSDGTARQEQGEYKNDTDQQGLSVRGSYKFVAPNGEHISVTYLADKNGYQPTTHEGDDKQQAAPDAAQPTAPAQS